jgi:hypothetical protein
MPVGGSDAFAISAGRALFRGGYKDRDTYHLFSLGSSGQTQFVSSLELRGQDDRKLVAERVAGRGDVIHLVSDGFLYRVDLQAVGGE